MNDRQRFKKELTNWNEFLWSLIIRARVGFRCELHASMNNGKAPDHLPCKGQLQAAHLMTRGVQTIQRDLRNGRCLCSAHHRYYTDRVEYWAMLCGRVWPEDWAYVTNLKWQGVNPAIDKVAVFWELYRTAQQYYERVPEYRVKLSKLEQWKTQKAEYLPSPHQA